MSTVARRAAGARSVPLGTEASITRLPREGSTSGSSAPDGRVSVDTGPDYAALSERYDLSLDRGRGTKLQRLEREFAAEKVQRWAGEGMPVETMGKPRDMNAFRERQASRPAAVPTDIERRNAASVRRNTGPASDGGTAGQTDTSASVRRVISRPGKRLDATVQREMESELGEEFGDVRIHTGVAATAAAEEMNARAFTVGNHVAFNRGEYDPGSTDGKQVLAHELTHVRQQREGTVSLLPKDGQTAGRVDGRGQHWTVQPKLEVSSPDDPAEKEAEAVADQVVNGDGPAAETRANGGRGDDSASPPAPGTAAGQSARGTDVSDDTESVVRKGVQGEGQPLPGETKDRFESQFGADFSDVSIHTGPEADAGAAAIGAKAYTIGSDIAFAEGEYQPGASAGQELLAHELTHVVQSDGSDAAPTSVNRQAAPARYFTPVPEQESTGYDPGELSDHLVPNVISGSWNPGAVISSEMQESTEIVEDDALKTAVHLNSLARSVRFAHEEDVQKYSETAKQVFFDESRSGEAAIKGATSAAEMDAKAEIPPAYTRWISDYVDAVGTIPADYDSADELAAVVQNGRIPSPASMATGDVTGATGEPQGISYSSFAEKPTAAEALRGWMIAIHNRINAILEQRFKQEQEAGQAAAQEEVSQLQGAADKIWQATHHVALIKDRAGFLTTVAGLKPVERPAVLHIWTDRAGVEHDQSRSMSGTIEDAENPNIPLETSFGKAINAYLEGNEVEGTEHALFYAWNNDKRDLALEILRTIRERGIGDHPDEDESIDVFDKLDDVEIGQNINAPTDTSRVRNMFEANEIESDIVRVLTNPELDHEEALRQADAYSLYNSLSNVSSFFGDGETPADEVIELLEERADDQAAQQRLADAYEEFTEGGPLREDLQAKMDVDPSVGDVAWETVKMGYEAQLKTGPIPVPWVPSIHDDATTYYHKEISDANNPYLDCALALLEGDRGRADAAKITIAGLNDDPETAIRTIIESKNRQAEASDILTAEQQKIGFQKYFEGLELETEKGTITGRADILDYLFEDEEVGRIVEEIHHSDRPEDSTAPIETILWGIEESMLGYGAPQDLMLDAMQQIAAADNTQAQLQKLRREAVKRDNGIDSAQALHEELGIGEGADGWLTEFSGREAFEAQRTYTKIVQETEGRADTLGAMYELARMDYRHISNGLFRVKWAETPARIEELWSAIQDMWDTVDEWAKQNEDGHYVEPDDGSGTHREFVDTCSQLATYGSMYDNRRQNIADLASNAVVVTVTAVGGTVATIASGGTLSPAAAAAISAAVSGAGEFTVKYTMMGESFTSDHGVRIVAKTAGDAALGYVGGTLSEASFIEDLKDAGAASHFAAAMVENVPSAAEGVVTDVDKWASGEVADELLFAALVEGLSNASAEVAVDEILTSAEKPEELLSNFDLDTSDVDEEELASIIQESVSSEWSQAFSSGLEKGTETLIDEAIMGGVKNAMGEGNLDDGVMWAIATSVGEAVKEGAMETGEEYIKITNQTYNDLLEDEVERKWLLASEATGDASMQIGPEEIEISEELRQVIGEEIDYEQLLQHYPEQVQNIEHGQLFSFTKTMRGVRTRFSVKDDENLQGFLDWESVDVTHTLRKTEDGVVPEFRITGSGSIDFEFDDETREAIDSGEDITLGGDSDSDNTLGGDYTEGDLAMGDELETVEFELDESTGGFYFIVEQSE